MLEEARFANLFKDSPHDLLIDLATGLTNVNADLREELLQDWAPIIQHPHVLHSRLSDVAMPGCALPWAVVEAKKHLHEIQLPLQANIAASIQNATPHLVPWVGKADFSQA